MITFVKSHFEKLLLILAGVALLLSAGWCWRREAVAVQPSRESHRDNADYRPAVSAAGPAAPDWHPPVAQTAGADWTFEVFSSPFICCDPRTGKLTAGTPQVAHVDGLESGIRLLAIRAAPYRVQLQGGFGPEGGYVAALAATETREVWCARPGERWVAMDVVLEKIDAGIDASAREHADAGVGHLARATVRDQKTGQRVVLVAGVPTMTRELFATVQLAGNSKTKNLREGDSCGDGEFVYRVDRLSLNPVVVAVVTKREPGREAEETLLLQPDTADAGIPGAGARAESTSHSHSFPNGP
jgi:hypothetical protein